MTNKELNDIEIEIDSIEASGTDDPYDQYRLAVLEQKLEISLKETNNNELKIRREKLGFKLIQGGKYDK